jgi:hypothetical protein
MVRTASNVGKQPALMFYHDRIKTLSIIQTCIHTAPAIKLYFEKAPSTSSAYWMAWAVVMAWPAAKAVAKSPSFNAARTAAQACW